MDEFAELESAIAAAGHHTMIRPLGDGHARLVCAQRQVSTRSANGFAMGGASFWVALRGGRWFVVNWAPLYYQLADDALLVPLCLHLLGSLRETPAEFDDWTRREFGLTQVDESQFDAA